MNDIPERGYGTWRQWRRRRKQVKGGHSVFWVKDGTKKDTTTWLLRHGVRPGHMATPRDAVEVML